MKIKSLFLLAFSLVGLNIWAQAPANYYNGTEGLTGAALKTKLSQIITGGHRDNGYDGLWTAYKTTDRDYFYENDGTILDMYSENPTGPDPYNFTYRTDQCGNYGSEGDCYNREHVVPQSLFGKRAPMVSDVHHIRATDGKVNGMRSNYPFGKVKTASWTSKNGSKVGSSASPGYYGTVFEPIDNFKGDVARMILYFVTRYESQLSTFNSGDMLGNTAFPGLLDWELNQLIQWHLQDPVSAEEIARNNASYDYQGNRNPFIDHPQWVQSIWGGSNGDTEAPTAPSGLTVGTVTANSVALSWQASTDNVSVTGYDIYVNGAVNKTVSTLSGTVTDLMPETTYTFFVKAKDAAGNSSAPSNTVSATTLQGQQPPAGQCGTETFDNIPTDQPSSYSTRTWTSNGITWTATDARPDQTINGKAITVRNGNLSSSAITGGIGSLTLTTQLKFSGSAGTLDVYVNNNKVGTIPYSEAVTTTTLSNIDVQGDFTLRIDAGNNGNRVAMDDLTWTCNNLSTVDLNNPGAFHITPNPVKNGEIRVQGKALSEIKSASIYSLDGRLLRSINRPFAAGNAISVSFLKKGTYILKAGSHTAKFIVD